MVTTALTFSYVVVYILCVIGVHITYQWIESGYVHIMSLTVAHNLVPFTYVNIMIACL